MRAPGEVCRMYARSPHWEGYFSSWVILNKPAFLIPIFKSTQGYSAKRVNNAKQIAVVAENTDNDPVLI